VDPRAVPDAVVKRTHCILNKWQFNMRNGRFGTTEPLVIEMSLMMFENIKSLK
jgi:hypothetical protein